MEQGMERGDDRERDRARVMQEISGRLATRGVEVRSDESDDLRWFGVDALPEAPPDVAIAVARGLARIRGRS